LLGFKHRVAAEMQVDKTLACVAKNIPRQTPERP